MKGTTTLYGVMEKVLEMSIAKHDQIIDLSDMEFTALNSLRMCGLEYPVLPTAQRLLAQRLRIPHQYLARCPAEVQATNLNYWLEREKERRKTFFCRFDGYKLRAVFTERYKPFDNHDVLVRMTESGFALDAEVHYTLDGTLMNLKIPEYGRQFVLPGNGETKDRMVPGISLMNSEVGYSAFTVEAYFYRLICSNGLITETSFSKRFKHISDRADMEFEGVLAQMAHDSNHTQSQLRISTETTVSNVDETFASFNRRFMISKKEAEVVKTAWELERGFTMFHVINAYTRAAQFPDLSAEESYRLEKAGGQILALVK